MNLRAILKEKQGTIVDVRTPVEFMDGHVPGSINIPLQEIRKRMSEIRSFKPPLILCCASGARSAHATKMLVEQGIQCINGGPWVNLNYSEPKNV
jgi:phage shock protein E